MNKFFSAVVSLVCVFMTFPVMSADRSGAIDSSRVGMRAAQSSTRIVQPGIMGAMSSGENTTGANIRASTNVVGNSMTVSAVATDTVIVPTSCRTAYRDCMDQFCLLDESEGNRCACSDNISASKSKIKEINEIQSAAEKLYGEGVERENLGAKAVLVFGSGDKAKKKGIDLSMWLNNGNGESTDLSTDESIGSYLYSMAAESCANRLSDCGKDAEMEELLYSRQVISDCKNFGTFLDDQKKLATENKLAAEKAVRQARLNMLDTTNKYNRGECLIAYKSCIADKGGCGANFENCLDAGLLSRRSNACDNVLDQCMAVKDYVKKDWQEESVLVLADAAKYADQNRRGTCFARIQSCLEDSCSITTNSGCLDNINVAAGICPVIEECNEMVPGIKNSVGDKLGFMRVQFCQNDVDKCLQDKCGANFDKAECVGRKPKDIVAMCPQDMFPSCKGQEQFDVIVSAVLLQMDYQLMVGCVNHFAETVGRVCGTDMACLPADGAIAAMTKSTDKVDWRTNVDAEVDNFFIQFEKDQTVAACAEATKPTGRKNMGASVFNTAKMLAKVNAEQRAERTYIARIAELSRTEDSKSAAAACDALFTAEQDANTGNRSSNKAGVWVVSAKFEPSLRNCHVCRVQKVCEEGGESKAQSAAKMAAGGAAVGTAASPGWGSLIGGVVGVVGGLFSGGEETFCQEIESCEDINM